MILAGVLALLFLGYLAIVVHELGHYLAYCRYGVPVEEAWKLVDSARSTDPEWAMEWSVRLNRSPLEKVPVLLDEMRRLRTKPVP